MDGAVIGIDDELAVGPLGIFVSADQNSGMPVLWNRVRSRGTRFTGKERDPEMGFDYFGARYLASAQGRFSSPDEPLLDQDPSDPQSWNLYAYVRNNPLIFYDPSGNEWRKTKEGFEGDWV